MILYLISLVKKKKGEEEGKGLKRTSNNQVQDKAALVVSNFNPYLIIERDSCLFSV